MAPDDTDLDARMQQWRDEADALMRTIESNPDAQAALEAASRLGDLARQVLDAVAQVRGRAAVQIRDKERLSLAVLAERIGVSKARADQLVRLGSGDKQREDADG